MNAKGTRARLGFVLSFYHMFADPQKNVEQFGLQAGQKVADMGAGSGFYSFAAAQSVGARGVVYAVDVQQDLITKLKNEARKRGAHNIEIIWGDIEKSGGTKLGDKSMDAVMLSNVLFQVPERESTLAEAFRILKPGGRLLLIDWSESFGGMGPSAEFLITKLAAQDMAERAGFKFDREITAGAHHYGIIFKKL